MHSAQLMTREILIIGGGIIGASIAYHLSARGCSEVTVLERGNRPGEGSTGRATGGFRAQFGTKVHVRLSLLARQKLLRFRDEIGADSGYRPCGYLFCASSVEQMEALRAAEGVQRTAGLTNVEFLTPAEMARLVPTLAIDDLLGGAFCPTDGFIKPLSILLGYVEAAQRLGAEFRWGEEVKEIEVRRGTVVGVKTDRNCYATRCVVNAAGAWAALVAELAGIRQLPVVPVRRQVAVTRPFHALPDALPMVIDCANGFHMRMRDCRALLLWADPAEPLGYNDRFDPAFLHFVRPLAYRRIRCLAEVPIDVDLCWAGLYELTPDHHGIIGPTKEVGGFFLANGFSGHGVMHAPAIGQLVAEMILDGRAHSLDISALRPERFEEGALNVERAVL